MGKIIALLLTNQIAAMQPAIGGKSEDTIIKKHVLAGLFASQRNLYVQENRTTKSVDLAVSHCLPCNQCAKCPSFLRIKF